MKFYSGKKVVFKLKKAGWTISRQKGSHIMMEKPSYIYTISIPQLHFYYYNCFYFLYKFDRD